MRAIIYTRVSSDAQEENYSLPTQLEACRAYAQRHGFEVVSEIHDVQTGSVLERPALSKARQIVRQGGAGALIVYSQDRLTRSVAHMLLLRDELKAAGAQLHAVSRGQSADTPEGRLFDTIEASFAEYERLKIKERMQRGKAGKAAGGKVVGGSIPPYGYRWVGRKADIRLVVDEDEAAIVRQVFSWYLEGASVREIVRRLVARGVPTPATTRARSERHLTGRNEERRGWGLTGVYGILRNEVSVGVYRYGSCDPVPVPAIVDGATWKAAQERREVGRLRSKRNAKRFYLLSGMIYCSCGGRMVGQPAGFKNGEHLYYACTATTKRTINHRTPCQHTKMLRADRVEGVVWQWVVNEVLDEGTIMAGVAKLREGAADRRVTLEAEAEAYQRQLDAAAAQVTKLIKLFSADILSLEEVAEQKRAIEAQRASAATELARVQADLAATGPSQRDVDAVLALTREIRGALAGGVPDEAKRATLELLDLHCTLVRDESGKPVAVDAVARLTEQADRLDLPVVFVPCSEYKHNPNVITLRARLPLAA